MSRDLSEKLEQADDSHCDLEFIVLLSAIRVYRDCITSQCCSAVSMCTRTAILRLSLGDTLMNIWVRLRRRLLFHLCSSYLRSLSLCRDGM